MPEARRSSPSDRLQGSWWLTPSFTVELKALDAKIEWDLQDELDHYIVAIDRPKEVTDDDSGT